MTKDRHDNVSAPDSKQRRTLSWQAFAAWAMCGLIWVGAYLSVVGVVWLPLAILLTILLTRGGLSGAARRWVWLSYSAWIVWWVLAVLQVAGGTTRWAMLSALAFVALTAVAGRALAGALAGIGLASVWVGLSSVWFGVVEGREQAWVWIGSGLLGIGAALVSFGTRPKTVETSTSQIR